MKNKTIYLFILSFIFLFIMSINNVNALTYWSEANVLNVYDENNGTTNLNILTTTYNITDICASNNGHYIYLWLQKSSTEFYILPLIFDNYTYSEILPTFINSSTGYVSKSFGCSADGKNVWYNNFYFSNLYNENFTQRKSVYTNGVLYNCNEDTSICSGSYGFGTTALHLISFNKGINWTSIGGHGFVSANQNPIKPCITSNKSLALTADTGGSNGYFYNGTNLTYLSVIASSVTLIEPICYSNTYIIRSSTTLHNITIFENNTKITTSSTIKSSGLRGTSNLSKIIIYNTTGLYIMVNNISNFTSIRNSTNVLSLFITDSVYTSTNPAISNITYGANFTQVGNVTFSNRQCMQPSNDGTEYLCNNTIYFDNGFYCNIDEEEACPTKSACVQQVYDSTSNTYYSYDPYKSCSNLILSIPVLKFKCPQDISTSLNDFIKFYFNHDCNISGGYYSYGTTAKCSDLSIWDYVPLYTGHNITTWGECVTINCSNFCNNGEYKCNSLQASSKCVLQPNGCYDWNMSTTCTSGMVCKSATGLCGLIITNNTCSSNADCSIIGQECYDGECITCNGCGNTGNGNNLSQNTFYIIMIIICIFIIIIFTILMASFGDATSGLLVGLVASMITSVALTIVWKLSLIIPILYIIIGGSIVAVIVRRIFAG